VPTNFLGDPAATQQKNYGTSEQAVHAKPDKKRYELQKDEEFIEYVYEDQPDGSRKRRKKIKKIIKKVKLLTEE